VKLNPKSSAAWADLGAIREMLGKNRDAVSAYSKAIELDPANTKSQMNRGWLLQRIGQYDQARADFLAIIEREVNNGEARTGLGYLDALQKSYDRAYEQAGRALVYGAGDYLILHNVACIYGEMAKTQTSRSRELEDAAIDTLKRAVELWKRGSVGPDEIKLIQQEPAFAASLRSRGEFKRLIQQ